MPRTTKARREKTGYDVIVIGGGSAGLSAAFSARSSGAKVALITDGMLGGECPNYACVPTKVMLAGASRYEELQRHGEAFGIRASKISFSLDALMRRKHAVVRTMTGNRRLETLLEKEGITVLHGSAAFVDDESIRVGTHVVSAKAFVIATGSVPSIPPIANIDDVPYWTPRDVTSMEELPDSVAIVGSGPVGCEFATFFSQLGIPVTMFDAADRLLPREDSEASALVHKSLAARGVTFHAHTIVLGVENYRGTVRLTYQTKTRPRQSLRAHRLIIAAGRVPNIEGLQLEVAGIRRNEQGRLDITPQLRVKGTRCFFAGDVTSLVPFTHTAHAEGVVAGENAAALARGARSFRAVDLSVVPYAIFVSPELASVGKSAEFLAKEGAAYSVYRFPVGVLGRSVIERERTGILKVCVDKRSGLVLGAVMVGGRAGEVIHELALAMHAKVPFGVVQSMIHAYPTMSEAIPGLMEA